MPETKDSLSDSASNRLIVALDVDSDDEAQAIVVDLGSLVNFYKVGWQLFMRSHFSFVKKLGQMHKRIFLDLKLDDIPETIQAGLRNAPDIEFIELMTLKGSSQLVEAARQGVKGANGGGATKFLMLTALSSLDDEDMKEMYGDSASIDQVVRTRAGKALNADCDGLIASGDSVRKLREWFGEDFLIVTPGIRPKGASKDDHKRTLTPGQAIRDGATYIVVGRPITRAKKRLDAAKAVIEEIEIATKDVEQKKQRFDSPLGAVVVSTR